MKNFKIMTLGASDDRIILGKNPSNSNSKICQIEPFTIQVKPDSLKNKTVKNKGNRTYNSCPSTQTKANRLNFNFVLIGITVVIVIGIFGLWKGLHSESSCLYDADNITFTSNTKALIPNNTQIKLLSMEELQNLKENHDQAGIFIVGQLKLKTTIYSLKSLKKDKNKTLTNELSFVLGS